MAEETSPLIEALPPASDYLTYLTIVEYNLSSESLPTLHKVLQDKTLTTNIGWDLVHLLVPYLPESEQCLRDIASWGNPREVILKVTESLRLIEYEAPEDENDADPQAEGGASDARARADSSTYPMKTAATAEGEKRPGSSQARELPPPLPLPQSQFVALLSMLSILHARIRTKAPSRFISTSLQAVLASFSNCADHREEMVLAVVKLIRSVANIKQPTPPSRQNSGMLTSSTMVDAQQSAGDPEESLSTQVTPAESAIQTKLVQSFVTHVAEEYLLNLPSGHKDVPGLAWCSRIMEKLEPERIIPERKTYGAQFQNEESLHRRVDAIGQLATVAQDLKITDEQLLSAAITVEKVQAYAGKDEDDPPASADEISLSRLGSLMLYAARQAGRVLYGTFRTDSTPPFVIFPDHHEIVKNCLTSPDQASGTLGTEPEALIDAILSLGLFCIERDAVGEPASEEDFNEYLQVTALLSSNCPSPNLRGHAHYLTSTILRSQPDDNARLAFIRDTLEHCPFENLKVSAVGWIKGETVEANPPTPIPGHDHSGTTGVERTSIFATPIALDTLSPFLFPAVSAELLTVPARDAFLTLRTNLSFYLASLNLLYLLLCAEHLHNTLSIQDTWTHHDVDASFIQPLRKASQRFTKEMDTDGELAEERSAGTVAELNVLNETLERVTNVARKLNG